MAEPVTWSHPFRLSEPVPVTRTLEADEAQRKAIAKTLDLLALDRLDATVSVEAWFDGVQVSGRWSADVAQTCGVTLERLDTKLSGDFLVRAVPPESVHAPNEESEAELDVEADDPPDVIEGGSVDLAAYVVEHLALEIDPFPRKPGVEFQAPEQPRERSPFDALRNWKAE